MAYQSINPYNGKVLQSFDTITDDELEAKIEVAEACFETWQNTSLEERGAILAKAASLMKAQMDKYAHPVTLEMGKPLVQARGEVTLSADIIAYYGTHGADFLAPVTIDTRTGDAYIESHPLGILFGVQPWNFPYYQLSRFAAPNLMAGNVVMVKHSGGVPQCAIAFEQLWRDAGAPKGAYTNLLVSHDQIDGIIADPRIKGVAFTGSVEAGRGIAQKAGKNLKKSTMELGGSDPFIVLEDADLNQAVKWAVAAKMNNTGQSCIAGKRFIVADALADAFLEKFKTALSALEPGDPMDAATTLAPLSSEGALVNLVEQVQKAVEAGAKLVIGGNRIDRLGAFMQPTILSDIKPENPAYDEEFFGPVALFFRVKNEDEAIALANDSQFGLGASIYTQDEQRGRRVASRINSGMVFVNRPTSSSPELPFGGVMNSGYGRELSELGIQEFVNKKLICLASKPKVA